MKKYPLFLAGILLAAGVIAQEDYQREVYIGGSDASGFSVPVTASNGTNSEVRLVNGNGNDLTTDLATRTLTTTTYAHHELHEGNSYHVEVVDRDLDTGDTNGFVVITANTTQWAHVVFNGDNTVAGTMFIYEDVVLTATGAAMTVFNRDRNSTNTSALTVYSMTGTTNSSLGTKIEEHLMGSAAAQSRAGGEGRGTVERKLKQNSTYFFYVWGEAENGRSNADLNFYLHTDKTD